MRLQCAVPTSEKFIVQLCTLYFRHNVISLSWPRSWLCVPSALNVNVKKFKKARVNGGSNYGNQTISSTQPSCWIQISTVDVINIATNHQMFMTLTGELSWHCLRRSAVDLYSKKTKKSLFEPPFRGALRGNVRTPYMARWKARGRLYISCDLTFFAISYGGDVISGNRSKSTFFEGGWVTLNADFRGKGASPTNHCLCQKTRVIAVSCGIKISTVHHLVLSQYTHLTDRRTDGQNCDNNTMRCITCRMVKM